MNIVIDVNENKLFKNIAGVDSERKFPIEITLESILDDAVQEINRYRVPSFRLSFEGDIILKESGTIFFTDYKNIKCSLPVFRKENDIIILNQKTRVTSRVLSELFITLLSSGIKIENLNRE